MIKYNIEVTKEQLHIIINSIDHVSRFNAGQLDPILEDINWSTDRVTGNRKEVEQAIAQLKKALFPEYHSNESSGIGIKEDDKLSLVRQKQYEIYRELMHQLSIRDTTRDWDCYKSPTLKYTDDDFPLVKLTTTE